MNIHKSIGFKRIACFIALSCCFTFLYSQEKLISSRGRIVFTSNAPLELIKATSDQLKIAIDPASGQFAAYVTITSFQGFNSGMQREHFNEKYLESDLYPNASFIGKFIEKIDFAVDGNYEVRAKGILDVHGKKQTRILKCNINVRNKIITMSSDFTFPLADHNIEVPRLVREKIATEVAVNVTATFVTK